MFIDGVESGNLHGAHTVCHSIVFNHPINFVVIEREPKLTQFNLVNSK